MATGGYYGKLQDTEKSLECPVCLEIFDNPISIPCGHTFCNNCLSSAKNISGSSRCPVCRDDFTFDTRRRARDIERQIRHSMGTCSGCNRQFPLFRLREHRSSCETVSPPPFSPIARTSQPRPVLKNRSTFSCPYCPQSNLDSKGMLQHVNSCHKHERQPVVCPICASMPWGNPNQKSGNFIQHINLRHKFDYDTYVKTLAHTYSGSAKDFNDEEDAILQQVLAQSIQDR